MTMPTLTGNRFDILDGLAKALLSAGFTAEQALGVTAAFLSLSTSMGDHIYHLHVSSPDPKTRAFGPGDGITVGITIASTPGGG